MLRAPFAVASAGEGFDVLPWVSVTLRPNLSVVCHSQGQNQVNVHRRPIPTEQHLTGSLTSVLPAQAGQQVGTAG